MAITTPDHAASKADRPVRPLGPTRGRKVDLSRVKDEARRSLARGDVGRELVLALPDVIDDYELDALFPMILRLLRDRPIAEVNEP